MDIRALKRILRRVETGTTIPTDADALRAILRPYLDPVPDRHTLATEEAHHGDKHNRRVGSRATVHLGFTRDRYRHGEYRIQATYDHIDGARSADRSHRVRIRDRIPGVIVDLWETVFDTAALALQNVPATITLRIDSADLESSWSHTLRTVAEIVAHELHTRLEATGS
jgi:hypothetical protein